LKNKLYSFIKNIFNNSSLNQVVDRYLDKIKNQDNNKLFKMIENQLSDIINSFDITMS